MTNPSNKDIDTGTDNENENDNISSDYHEPIWLRGLHDPTGILNNAVSLGHIVDNCEVNVTEDFSSDGLQEATDDFFRMLCRLKGLKSLRFLPDKFSTIYPIPVHLLTVILQEVPGLQMISLCSLEVQGTPEEFERWLYWLRHHPSLHLVRLIRCQLPEDADHMLLDTLVVNLSKMSRLKEVELSAAEELSWSLSLESLQRLYQSDTLEKLRLDNFDLSTQQLLSFFRSLECNDTNLKGLFLASCQAGKQGLHAMASMLGSNQSLEEVSVCFTTDGKLGTCEDECFAQMAIALRHNATLRLLRISGTSASWPNLGIPTRQSFVDMLRTKNTTLEALSICANGNLHADLNFYLAVNRMGRKHLVKDNATKEDWFPVVLNSQVDLNCLYFFLSMKPEFLVCSR